MTQNLGLSLVTKLDPECFCDMLVVLVEHDDTSAAYLTSMVEQFSYKVVHANEASKAVSIIETQKKNIGFIILNTETPQIDSQSFHTILLRNNIPFILINPERTTKKTSDILTKRACFSLNKPISKEAIKNLWQHVSHKKRQVLENVMDNDIYSVEAFRETLKRQRTNQCSLLGRPQILETFKTLEACQMRRDKANGELKTKIVCHTEIDNKEKEKKKMESNLGIGYKWTIESHMHFLNALSTLGENYSCPTAILRIMNEKYPDLTYPQVYTYLQKYKDQVERINALPINEWKSTDLEYPFKSYNLWENFIASNPSSSTNFQSSVPPPIRSNPPNVHGININIEWIPFQESNGDMIFSGANTTEVGLITFETTHAVVGSVIPLETNVEHTSLGRYDDDYDDLLVNLICYDNNVGEMDIQSCLGDNGSSDLSHEFAFNTPTTLGSRPNITTEAQDHSYAMDSRSTNQPNTITEREGNDWEWIGWIEEILNTDA